MIMIMFNMRSVNSLLASSLSLDIVPRLCRFRTDHCRAAYDRDLQYWPLTLVSLIPRLFHYVKRQLRTGSVEMVRVVCTHPVNPPGVVQGDGVLCSQVAQIGSCFGGSE
jgi:hypothetical protein